MSGHHLGRLGGGRAQPQHPQLEPEVKRAIFASWTSEARPARSRLTLRKPSKSACRGTAEEVLDASRNVSS